MQTGIPKEDIATVLRRVESQLRAGAVINPDLVKRAADEIERLRRGSWHLVSMLEFLSEATGEGLELEDAALLDQIKADLPPHAREELPGSIAAQTP